MAKKRHKGGKKARTSFDGVIKVLGMPFNFTSDLFKKIFNIR